MPDFNQALNRQMSAVEPPKMIPPGTYTAMVTKIPDMETSPDGRWDFLTFNLRLTASMEDVDPESLADYGGIGSHSNTRRRFLFDKGTTQEAQVAFDRTLFDVKRFLVDHLKCATEETSLKEGLNNAVNQPCIVTMKWRADKNDPQIMYSEVSKTAPIEA
jgi:hypothetical protein